jgi:hypothetical protein
LKFARKKQQSKDFYFCLLSQIIFCIINFSDIVKSTKGMCSCMITISALLKMFAHITSQAKIRELILNITKFMFKQTSKVSNALFIRIEKKSMKLFQICLWSAIILTFIYGWMPAVFQFYLFWNGTAIAETYVIPFDFV